MNNAEKASGVVRATAVVIFLCLAGQGSAQTQQLVGIDRSETHREMRGTLINALVFVSGQFHIPIIGELVAPLDHELIIPSGTHSARQLLDQLVAQSRDYDWTVHSGVVHFYEKSILSAQGNFLNQKLRAFKMPPNVSDLKLILRERLSNAAKGLTGAAISYMGSPELRGETIAPKRLENVTGRKILLTAAELTPKFTSIVVFPKRQPKGSEDIDYSARNWFWLPVSGENLPSIQLH